MTMLRNALRGLLIFLSIQTWADEPSISIRPLENGLWEVDYQLLYPVNGLQFMRSAGFLREENWQIRTPGYRFVRNESGQALELVTGAKAAQRIKLIFPIDTRFINRDYELFNSFSDGSLAMFTGHFYVRPFGEHVPIEYSQGYLADIGMTPPTGSKIGLKGEVTKGSIRWTDTSGEGTYAYIGNTPTVTTSGITAIFDLGLPEWVAQEARLRIPQIMAFYTEKLGRHSEFPPLVLFSYEPEGSEGYAYNGGTRSDLIQIRVQGPSWQQESAESKRTLIHFFAHEAAHLWNGQAARSAAKAPPWLHEGSADAMAERAMLALGIINTDQYRNYQESALNQCLTTLSSTSLNNSLNSRAHYDCGNIIALWSELALQEKVPDADLFDIWRNLIESESRSNYDQSTYFNLLEDMGITTQLSSTMSHFTEKDHHQPAPALASEFALLGLEMKRNDSKAQQDALVASSGTLVNALLQKNCSNGYGFYNRGSWLELAHLNSCQIAREGFRIDLIEHIPIAARNFEAYKKAARECTKDNTIELGNNTETITLPCPENVPPLTGWWTLR